MGYHRKLSFTGQWQFCNSPIKMSLTGQWQYCSHKEWVITENCHWLVNDNFEAVIWKVSLTIQWQFWSHPWIVLGIAYQRKLSLTGQWQFWGIYLKIVIDRSMTILKVSFEIVIDWSMTISKPPFGLIRNRLSQKNVIDFSMKILKQSFEKCHWPVNDNFEASFWSY